MSSNHYCLCYEHVEALSTILPLHISLTAFSFTLLETVLAIGVGSALLVADPTKGFTAHSFLYRLPFIASVHK